MILTPNSESSVADCKAFVGSDFVSLGIISIIELFILLTANLVDFTID